MRLFHRDRSWIPAFVPDRAPTPELAPDQVDPGFDASTWERRVRAAEHKRWVAGVALKAHDASFGTGRLMPITRAR